MQEESLKQAPFGISDFKKIRSNKNLFYVDKTGFISEFIAKEFDVLLVTRPRRFGKTLNLSTLKYFFDINEKSENLKLFEGLKVTQDKRAMSHFGSRPVIYLSFKGCANPDWQKNQLLINGILANTVNDFLDYFQNKDGLVENILSNILNRQANYEELTGSIKYLAEVIIKNTGIEPLVLIDEYDAPIQAAWGTSDFDQALNFFKDFYTTTSKDNIKNFKALLTGCVRIAKESIFSGMNNLDVAGISSNDYGTYFGFTEVEVKDLLKTHKIKTKFETVKSWYNGYYFGDTVIYNPWSIINLISKKGKLDTYWRNVGQETIIKKLLALSGIEEKELLKDLIAGKTIVTKLNEKVVFQDILKSKDNLFNFLYAAGFLRSKTIEIDESGGNKTAYLEIPNVEMLSIFKDVIESWFQEENVSGGLNKIKDALLKGDIESFSGYFSDLVIGTLSYFDTSKRFPEKFYHGFMLGLFVNYSDIWLVESEQNAGYGRCDILLTPKNSANFGVVIELKTHREDYEKDLDETVKRAMEQIENNQYAKTLKTRGAKKILLLAVGFLGQKTKVLGKVFA